MAHSTNNYDALVIGNGFAGLTAALWLGRYRRSCLAIGKGPVRNHNARHLHGYPGYDNAPPNKLLNTLRQESETYGSILREGWVETVRRDDTRFVAMTNDGKTYTAKTVLLATGVQDIRLSIAGFQEREGKDIWHCPACDGYEYTGKKIVVIGWNNEIVEYTKLFLQYSKHVTLLTHGNTLPSYARRTLQSSDICIVTEKIRAIEGAANTPDRLILEDGSNIGYDGIFYKIDTKPRLALARQLGCKLGENCIAVDHKQQTSIPGVFVAGDIAPFEDLVVVACATGAIAASNMHEYLAQHSA